MKTSLMLVGVAFLGILTSSASADLLAGWSFDSLDIPSGTTGTVYGPIASDGVGEVYGGNVFGRHASSSTGWFSVVGNGSPKSFSSNYWAAGDHYEFRTSTLGYENITVGWDQTRSSTGPGVFDLEYSLDGINFFTIVNDYNIQAITWTSVPPPNSASTFGPYAAPPAIDNQPIVYFRLTSQVAGSSTAGTNRIDNILVSGTLIPEPTSLVLLLTGLWIIRRR